MRPPRFRFTLRRMMVAVALLAPLLLFDHRRQMTFPMTWRFEEPGANPSRLPTDETSIVLKFRDYPGHFVGITSDHAASYLRGLGSETVSVTLEVTTDWGNTRGIRLIRVGELTSGWGGESVGIEFPSEGPPPGESPYP